MDGNLVYEKTLAGDEATRNRTRLVQRNLRMILVLVDGVSNVAELIVKAGNSQIVYAALKELEAGGFITLASRKNTPAKSIKKPEKTAESGREPGFSHFSEFSTFGAGAMSSTKKATKVGNPAAHPQKPELSIIDVPPVGGSGAVSQRIEPSAKMHKASDTSGFESTLPPPPKSRSSSTKRGSRGSTRSDAIKIKPIKRNQKERTHISWPLALLIGIVGILGLAIVTLFFFPYNYFKPDVEAALSQALGRNIVVGDIHMEFYPKPLLTLNQVNLGGGKSELAIGNISFRPTFSLLSDTKSFTTVEVNNAQLKAGSLPLLRDAMKSLAVSPNYAIRNIKLADFTISGKDFSYPSLHGNIDISGGLFKGVTLSTENETLSFTISPQKGNIFNVLIEGRDWQPFASNTNFKLDFFHAEGPMDNERINFSRFDMHMFNGGVVKGNLTLDIADKIIVAEGQMNYEQINAKKLMEFFKTGLNISGDMKGQFRVISSAEKWKDLSQQAMVEGNLSVQRGEIVGIDFEQAMRRVQSAAGGSTRFEQINSDFTIDETGTRLSHLNFSSGLVTAEGDLMIDTKNEIKGSLDILLKSSANRVKTPVQLSGTLKKPQLIVN